MIYFLIRSMALRDSEPGTITTTLQPTALTVLSCSRPMGDANHPSPRSDLQTINLHPRTGNKTHAAENLGVTRRGLRIIMERVKIPTEKKKGDVVARRKRR